MSWMNESDVEYCNPETQVLRTGADFLRAFMNLINSISDGWAYWSYGTKCSNDLQELLQTPRCAQAQVTEAQVTAATRKVVLFLKRCKQTKDNPTVRVFLRVWS